VWPPRRWLPGARRAGDRCGDVRSDAGASGRRDADRRDGRGHDLPDGGDPGPNGICDGGPVVCLPGTYQLLGRSAVETVAANSGLNHFLTRIPTRAGELLGISELDAGSACEHAASPTDVVAGAPPPAPDIIGDQTQLGTSLPNLRINVAAVVEPDVDVDGYGDETQDGCPGDPLTFDQPCRSDLGISLVAPTTTAMGSETALQITVTNAGPSIAKGVVVSYQPPPGVHFVSGHSDFHCGGDDTLVTCNVGTIPSPGSLPTYIALLPTQQGAFTSTVTVAGANNDFNRANNSASAVTTVGPPLPDPTAPPVVLFAGLKVADNQVLSPDAKRVIVVRVSCPTPATARCTGVLTLRSAGKVAFPRKKGSKRKPASKILTLGSGRFSIPVTKSASVRVKISPTALTILRQNLSLDVVGTAVARDGAAHAATTTGDLIVTPPSKAARKKKHKKH
jgi:uncharacterized repeat protein (TIGR01451 family)